VTINSGTATSVSININQSISINQYQSININQSISINQYQLININIFNSRLEAHAQQHVTIQLKTMKIKTEYSANDLELVKKQTRPMPTQR